MNERKKERRKKERKKERKEEKGTERKKERKGWDGSAAKWGVNQQQKRPRRLGRREKTPWFSLEGLRRQMGGEPKKNAR